MVVPRVAVTAVQVVVAIHVVRLVARKAAACWPSCAVSVHAANQRAAATTDARRLAVPPRHADVTTAVRQPIAATVVPVADAIHVARPAAKRIAACWQHSLHARSPAALKLIAVVRATVAATTVVRLLQAIAVAADVQQWFNPHRFNPHRLQLQLQPLILQLLLYPSFAFVKHRM
jgi:hypothetical protein